jgi:tetratricopeptide (TPR) repeat protein
LEALADAWFNRALAALAEGRPGRALEWLSACCAARPTDAEARRAQAKAWAQLGRWVEARDALDRAAEIDPDAAELEVIRQAVDAAEAQAAPKAPRPSGRPGARKRKRRRRPKR